MQATVIDAGDVWMVQTCGQLYLTLKTSLGFRGLNSVRNHKFQGYLPSGAQLLGTPDVGGEWTLGGSVVPEQFIPATDAGGIFMYTVDGGSHQQGFREGAAQCSRPQGITQYVGTLKKTARVLS